MPTHKLSCFLTAICDTQGKVSTKTSTLALVLQGGFEPALLAMFNKDFVHLLHAAVLRTPSTGSGGTTLICFFCVLSHYSNPGSLKKAFLPPPKYYHRIRRYVLHCHRDIYGAWTSAVIEPLIVTSEEIEWAAVPEACLNTVGGPI